MDNVISVIKGSIELWPSLVEICYFHKSHKGLPQIRVKHQKRRGARKAEPENRRHFLGPDTVPDLIQN